MSVAIVNSNLSNLLSTRVALSARSRRLLGRFLLVLLLTLPCIAFATPPAWAPAHGWREKHDPAYAGYSGRQWTDDYGVRSGTCNRAGIGAVLGGVAGGTVGAAAGKGDSRPAAIVVGAVIGAAIGAEIGRRMDRADLSCVGHTLELTGYGQSVSWTNPNTQVTFQLTPLGGKARTDGCRKFRLIAHDRVGLSEGRTVACPSPEGVWSLAPDLQVSRR